MNPELKKTIIVLHIAAVLYILLGIAYNTLLPRYLYIPYSSFISLFLIGFGILVEIVVAGLKKNKYWSWIAGIIICVLYIPSIFIILGIIGLIGLLNKNTIKAFQRK